MSWSACEVGDCAQALHDRFRAKADRGFDDLITWNARQGPIGNPDDLSDAAGQGRPIETIDERLYR